MGLDMYLSCRKFLWEHSADTAVLRKSIAQSIGLPPEIEIDELRGDVGYWRKANAIHGWFVNNVQAGVDDCNHYDVSREQLKQLRDICADILAHRDSSESTAEIMTGYSLAKLPPTSGFFFGSNDIDEWYYKDLEDTITICDRALMLPPEWMLQYHSSW